MGSRPNSTGRGHGLRDEERVAFARDGFLVRRSVLGAGDLEELRTAVESVVLRAEAASPQSERYAIDGNRYIDAIGSTIQLEHCGGSGTIRVIEPFHHLHPRLDRLVDDPRIVEPVSGIIGTDEVGLWTEKINLKRPREGSGFRWHQDSPYWTHACSHVDRLPNVMVALDDADESNGCFRVIRASHRAGCLPGIDDGSTLGPLFTRPDAFDESDQVPMVLPAGSLVFFSPHSVHGSEPNHSDAARRALVLTYQPAGYPMFKRPSLRTARPAAGGLGPRVLA